jgi:formiminoglutamase/guanidinobutyrase
MKGRSPVGQTCVDSGDAVMAASIEGNHESAAELVAKAHGETGLSVVVGGSHDHGYSHLLGIARTLGFPAKKPKLGCINIDAHLDVRTAKPFITSGSPFYLALESGVLDPSRFVEFGIQSHCNSDELWKYVEKHEVAVVELRELRQGKAIKAFEKALERVAAKSDAVVVSFDLDACAQAYAPGVSAPQAEGFSSREAIEMIELAGAHAKVCSLGIFELNPEHDVEQMTARLAATAAWHFIEAAL